MGNMTLKWNSMRDVTTTDTTISVRSSSKAAISEVLPTEQNFTIEYTNLVSAIVGICTPDLAVTPPSDTYPRDKRNKSFKSGLMYPEIESHSLTWTKEDKITMSYDKGTKKVSLYKNDVFVLTLDTDISKKPFCWFVSAIGSSYTATATYSFSILQEEFYLLQKNNELYTISNDTLVNLGVATDDRVALFEQGFETLTKANCETIASQLGKCKILRAKV